MRSSTAEGVRQDVINNACILIRLHHAHYVVVVRILRGLSAKAKLFILIRQLSRSHCIVLGLELVLKPCLCASRNAASE
jgi:hypothetical protein